MKSLAQRPHRRIQAFTLIEMIFVLAIISILVGMGAFQLRGVLGGASEGRVQSDLATLKTNLVRYHTLAMTYPTQAQGLSALVKQPSGGPKRWRQLCSPEGIIDPYGNEYGYRYPARKSSDAYDIFSLGPDGRADTEDDFGNW